ncbi:hypothetical protein ADJ70_08320 [Olsenella sp. oral taxon 807]|uniref:hypothetical protein n=1 Tax=Olsenella sp. oral taxon 807 TaxID=712411 RepID=UPI00067A2F91|nr:hypothetical protein [Olsenella sp. oral taxon 807]AKT48942.1 hypothetical protein ADJ70_08320 [Olsenella sp. oral taxon 807]
MADSDVEAVRLKELVGELGGANRRRRQDAAHEIARLAKKDVDQLFDYAGDIIDGLDRPEAQTRWELLDALSEMARVDPGCVEEAFGGAEASLFDEDSSIARLAAFRFLTSYGATSGKRSDQVWKILEEAIQCYHGDPEYRDMLGCLLEMAKGTISDQTAQVMRSRVDFDARHGRGYIKAFSAEIVEAIDNRLLGAG